MDEQKVKNMLNREVLHYITDDSIRFILTTIIYDDNTVIDWDNAYQMIMAFMPELKKYEGYKLENMRKE